VYVIERIVSWI